MKRPIYDVLRRAFDSTVTNWQLLLLRVGVLLVDWLIAAAVALAVIVPMLISVGVQLSTLRTTEDFGGALVRLLEQRILFVWIFVAVSVLLVIFVAIQSFLEAGCVRVYVDAESAAGPEMTGRPARFRTFSMERWYSGGVEGWWTVFWIYNIGWGLPGLLLLIPLVPTIVLMLVLRNDNDNAAIAIGCLGLLVSFLLGIVVFLAGALWVTRATAEWGVRRVGAREALRIAWRAVMDDFGRHFLIALAAFGVAFAGSMFFSTISYFAAFAEAFGGDAFGPFVTFPLRMIGSLLNGAFSGAVASWFVAAYVALAVESKSYDR